MRVLIVSEGPNELGKAEHAGALEALVARLRTDVTEFDSITVRHPELGKVHAKGEGGMFKRAIACLRYAERYRFDAVVVVVDQDDEKYKYRRNEFSRAQESDKYLGVRRALGVAVLTFDAWMLADEVALTGAFGTGTAVMTQPNPEMMGDAKSQFKRLRDTYGCEEGSSELYAEVARRARIEVLEERCKEGFGVFARRVRGM
jgi:hypothetical protein